MSLSQSLFVLVAVLLIAGVLLARSVQGLGRGPGLVGRIFRLAVILFAVGLGGSAAVWCFPGDRPTPADRVVAKPNPGTSAFAVQSAVTLAKPVETEPVPFVPPEGFEVFEVVVIDPTGGAGDWIRPRDRVDVLYTLDLSEYADLSGAATSTLLQNAEVIAVGKVLNPEVVFSAAGQRGPHRKVRLLVKSDQVILLETGQAEGFLSLILRDPNEVDEEDMSSESVIRTLPPASPESSTRTQHP